MHTLRFASLSGALLLTAAAWAGPPASPAKPVEQVRPPILPTPLASFGAVRDGDWLYLYSGHQGPTHHHSFDNLSPVFGRLSLHDMKTWELFELPVRTQSAALVAHQGRIIRIGGLTAKNRAGEEDDLDSLASVQAFDPLTRSWSDLPDLPQPRSSHDAVVIGDTLYVVGGWAHQGSTRAEWLEEAYALDLSDAQATWQALPKPPFSERRAIALAGRPGELWVVGGMTWEHQLTQETWVLELARGEWRQGPSLPFKGFGAAAIAHEGELYASGIDSELYRLERTGQGAERQEAWVQAADLTLPRFFHRFVPLGADRLLAVGGVTRTEGKRRNVHQRTTEVVDLARGHSPLLTSFTVPVPGAAKNRQGIALHEDTLYVFGGNNSLEQHDFGPDNFLDQAWKIELGTFRVAPLPALPVKRQSMLTHLVPGVKGNEDQGVPSRPAQLLAVGGFGHNGEGTQSWDETLWLPLGQDSRWERRPAQLPQARTQFELVPHGDRLFLFGGLDYDDGRPRQQAFQFPTSVLVAPAHGDGQFTASGIELPGPRRAYGGAKLGERYYLIGGMKAGFTLVEDVDVFDFQSRSWSKAPAPSYARISPEVVTLGGKIYVIGGTRATDEDFVSDRSVEVFDPETQQWTRLLDELPFVTTHLRAFAHRGRILLYSAHTAGAQAIRLTYLDPRAAAAATPLSQGKK